MALIICSECGKEISDKSFSCPNCGKSVGNNAQQINIATDTNKPIQAEPLIVSKKWKTAKLISWTAVIIGWFCMANSGGSWKSDNIQFWFGFALVGYGFMALMISKIGAWYNDRSSR